MVDFPSLSSTWRATQIEEISYPEEEAAGAIRSQFCIRLIQTMSHCVTTEG